MAKNKQIISIDPGNLISGVIILTNGLIEHAENKDNVVIVDFILKNVVAGGVVLIEDIKPYSVSLRQSTIDTCKWIGVLEYLLKQAGIAPVMTSRREVKEWAFNTFPDVCLPRLTQKIERKGLFACDVLTRQLIRVTKDGRPWKARKPFYGHMDDRVMVACMKEYWKIETPKPGQVNRLGVSKHSWQALALATLYVERGILSSATSNKLL